MADDIRPTLFESADAFRAWLRENQDSSSGVWLAMAKKGSGLTTVNYAEALDVALEYGWIDGQTRRIDELSYMQRFSPRRPQSPWSLRNRTAAEAMIAEGRMAPRGLAEIERAKANGRWDKAYEGSRTAEPHPDFFVALEQNPAAKEFYATLNSQNRYAVYFRIHEAKRADTRIRRIENFVAMFARGEKPH